MSSSMYLKDVLSSVDSMTEDTFEDIVKKYIEMNIAHPFREGNGRSTRIWLDMILKKEIGKVIDWSKVDKEDYLKILNPDPYRLSFRWQLEYARLFERQVDNSKVLAATGMKQSEMMPLYEGLKREISRTPKDYPWRNNQRMDDYLAAMK